MESRPLGNSGLEVSALCVGSWLTFEYMAREDALAVMAAAVDGGVRFLDDARYDDHTGRAPMKTGYSEVVFGELFRSGGFPRDEFVIANKLWFEFFPEETIEAELDGSLARLGMDVIDVVYCAPPPDSLPVEELVPVLDGLVGKGKLRAWGVLNWTPAEIEAAHRFAVAEGLAPPTAAQLPHNLIDRGFVEGPSARRVLAGTGVAVVASHCLAGGLLTGKYSRAGARGRLGAERIEALRERGVLDRVEGWAALAARHGATAAQLCLAFSLSRPGVASACFGARSVAQLEENLGALEVAPRLAEAIAQLEADTGEPADPA
jgi:L-glyceraldehyde 3-phosphate reductase